MFSLLIGTRNAKNAENRGIQVPTSVIVHEVAGRIAGNNAESRKYSTSRRFNANSLLHSHILSDLEIVEKAQCFPLYTYEKVASDELLVASEENAGSLVSHHSPHGTHHYIRRDNISDAMLQKFQQKYSPLATQHSPLTKEDIFYYVYGILHSDP
jgi:predicted helicase